MSEAPEMPRKLMLLIAVLQGMALLLLKTATDGGSWPSQDPVFAYPLWTLALSVPVLLLLSLDNGNLLRIAKQVGGFAFVALLVSVYTGSQAEPWGEFPVSNLTGVFTVTMALACFKALMYCQQRGNKVPLTYETLFTYSWRNVLTFGLSVAFTFAVWLIFLLWGQLFDAIGVSFFQTLFDMDWFRFVVLSLAFGAGVIMFRNLTGVIDAVTRLLRGLIMILLPLVVLVGVLFGLSLPFTGLDALWDTGNGTALVLWLLALLLFFANAVYQDGRGDPPYPAVLHRTIYGGLLVMPVLSALAFYGLYLRLTEYGWTVARCWAFIVWLVLSLFAFGYVVGIIRRRDEWTQDLARVNTVMGLVVLAILLAANSPLLDFRKISAASQLARIDAGIDELADFDAWYAHSELARPGYLAIDALKTRVGDSDPGLLERLENPRPFLHGARVQTARELWEDVLYRPQPFEIPEEVRARVDDASWPLLPDDMQLVAIRADLNEDDVDDYVFVLAGPAHLGPARIVHREAGRWVGTNATIANGTGAWAVEQLKGSDIRVVPRRLQDLEIGDVLIRTMP